MSLQSQLDNLIHEFCKRKISHPKLLEKILTDDARICPRLLELLMSKLDMKIILDELVSQALIWMDDEYKQGDVYILQKLSLVLENNQELLLMYDNLVRTLVQDQPRPDLRIPPIIVNDLKIALVPLGWICTRKFLDHLGIADGDINSLNKSNLDKSIDEALRIFTAQSQGLFRSNEELLLHVIQTLENIDLVRPARKLKDNFLL